MYKFYIDGKEFLTDDFNNIPRHDISSLDENTPAFENLETGYKRWCEKGNIWHRLTGPAIIWSDGKEFWLNDQPYENVDEWLKYHPNQDEAFKKEMLKLWN
jgi:hypothetical protein